MTCWRLKAEQMDVHEPTTTVREAMRFSAYLRQPYSVSKDDKDDYVESIIELLELQESVVLLRRSCACQLMFSVRLDCRKP